MKQPKGTTDAAIAIIGMACRFPGAADYRQFWQNLISETVSIQTVAAERWDWRDHVDDTDGQGNQLAGRYAGFIDDIDKFDPGFFGIPPKEAAYMDPQHRLFLQCAWHAIEDAGYAPGSFAGTLTGIYCGVSKNDYAELMREKSIPIVPFVSTGTVHSLITNRLSFLLDTKGKSEVVDTACSSSLVALHNAIDDLLLGYCDSAIVGGVNAILAPTMSLSHTRSGMLAADGRIKTFDQSADGYVRGEGVAVIVLKPLAVAREVGDSVHGLIKAVAVNHSGRASFLTSPSAAAQAEVIQQALTRADIAPRSISYIECHGTGTALGDPIEIEGIKKAWQNLAPDTFGADARKTCALGSVKPNIGHLEPVAGLAGLIKVVLALKHRQLPALLNYQTQNPYIELDDSPFYILTERQSWQPSAREYPLRAGVSSFGMGGVNAHVIVEAWDAPAPVPLAPEEQYLIPLSTKPGRLRDYLTLYRDFLTAEPTDGARFLADLSYTLRVGRDHYPERIAFVVSSVEQLGNGIETYLNDCPSPQTWYAAQSLPPRTVLETLARDWVNQADSADIQLSSPTPGQRIPLPGYPFAKRRCWFEATTATSPDKPSANTDQSDTMNEPTKIEPSPNPTQPYAIALKDHYAYLRQHWIQQQNIMPASAYFEFVREALISLDHSNPVLTFTDVYWLQPCPISEDKTLWVELRSAATEASSYHYRIRDEQQTYTRGVCTVSAGQSAPTVTKKMVPIEKVISTAAIYQGLRDYGIDHGPEFQVLKSIQLSGRKRASAYAMLPANGSTHSLSLNPCLIDGFFQVVTHLGLATLDNTDQQYVPFTLDKVVFYRAIPPSCWIEAIDCSPSATALSYDLRVYDQQNTLIAEFNGFKKRRLLMNHTPAKPPARFDDLYYTTAWQPDNRPPGQPMPQHPWIVVYGDLDLTPLNAAFPTATMVRYADFEPVPPIDGVIYLIGSAATDPSGPDCLAASLAILPLTQQLMALKPRQTLPIWCVVYDHPDACPIHQGLVGFAKTLAYENPKLSMQVVGVDTVEPLALQTILVKEMTLPTAPQRAICYRQQEGLVQQVVPAAAPEQAITHAGIRRNGVYLIVGGSGGLGRQMAQSILAQCPATVILLGRRAETPEITERLQGLSRNGGQAVYYSADITDVDQVNATIAAIKTTYAELHGVVYAAGVISDAFILRKDPDSFERVLATKILGCLAIDRATQAEPLDFFVMFSSIAAVMPNQGQGDYASGNAFLDGFASRRNQWVGQGRRSGHSLAIGWPLWKEGGIQIAEAEVAHLDQVFGMKPLDNADGVRFFEQAIAALSTGPLWEQIVFIQGDRDKIERHLKVEHKETSSVDHELRRLVRGCAAATLERLLSREDEQTTFHTLGLESQTLVAFVAKLKQQTELALNPTLLFEHNTIQTLASYLLDRSAELKQRLHNTLEARQTEPYSLIDLKQSSPDSLIFRKTFTTEEFYLQGHQRDGMYNLPGACYLEMARQAGAIVFKQPSRLILKNNLFLQRLSSYGEAIEAGIRLIPGERHYRYEVIRPGAGSANNLYVQGEILTAESTATPESIDIQSVIDQSITQKTKADIIEQMIAEGDQVDQHFIATEQVFIAADRAVGRLQLSASIQHSQADFMLHPALLAGFMQTARALDAVRQPQQGGHIIPVGVGLIDIHAPLPSPGFAYVMQTTTGDRQPLRKFTGYLTDRQGRVCVVMEDFAIKEIAFNKVNKTSPMPTLSSAPVTTTVDQVNTVSLVGVIAYLKNLLAPIMGYDIDEMDEDALFEDYMINSVIIVEINHQLSRQFADLSKTLLFEYGTIGEVAGYLVDNHPAELRQIPGIQQNSPPVAAGEDHQDDTGQTPDQPAAALASVPLAEPVIKQVDNSDTLLPNRVVAFLKQLLAPIMGYDIDEMDEDALFEDYMINSVIIVEINHQLAQRFADLSKTLLFEYGTIREVADYFIANHGAELQTIPGIQQDPPPVADSQDQPQAADNPTDPRAASPSPPSVVTPVPPQSATGPTGPMPIAIIGLAGHYPMADTLEQFWQNLKTGKDCITEIPPSRFDYRRYYQAQPDQPGLHAKWGSFIDGVDEFDPLFFKVAPRTAGMIDPQERLFLTTSWQCLEEAGYPPECLADATVGVFVGALWQPYESLGTEQTLRGNPMGPSAFLYSIANRVSYTCNFHGPSMAVDTACSASLTALHLACNSLYLGECDYVLSGGVNLSIQASKYLFLSDNQFLSSDGKCRSFGDGGDGYVPGEGVGAVLLKPLRQALEDEDHIYGVIRAIGANHGGKTNGYTVPNPNAQRDLILKTLKQADIDPATISYIEAHGTGTNLGDPIEITGLSQAFAQLNTNATEQQYCAIGSVKSNIGHLEAAAGIVGLTKILLQFQHRQLAPSIHSEALNSNINFANTPFYVQRELAEWTHNSAAGHPRRAALSSFGAGGSNVHLVVEEGPERVVSDTIPQKPGYLLTLSAKTKEALKQKQIDLSHWLTAQGDQLPSLGALSYNLNARRSHFNYRCALVVHSVAALDGLLQESAWRQQTDPVAGYFYGVADNSREDEALYRQVQLGVLEQLEQGRMETAEHYKEQLTVLAELYVKGRTLEWDLLNRDESRQKLSLPTYPFARERYWIREHPDTTHKARIQARGLVGGGATGQRDKMTLKPLQAIQTPGDSKTGGTEGGESAINHKDKRFADTSTFTDFAASEDRGGDIPITPVTAPVGAESRQQESKRILKRELAATLYIGVDEINEEIPLIDLGIDSILGVELIDSLNKALGTRINAAKIYDYPTVKQLADYLATLIPEAAHPQTMAPPAPDQATTERLLTPVDQYGDLSAATGWYEIYHLNGELVCLRDHRVHQQSVMPTDAYIELVYVAASRLLGSQGLTLSHVNLLNPLIVKATETVTLQVNIRRVGQTLHFLLSSLGATPQANARLHIKGDIQPLSGLPGKYTAHKACLTDKPTPGTRQYRLDHQQIYAPGKPQAMVLGPFYQTIQTLIFQESVAVSRLALSPEADWLRGGFALHPAIVDGFLVTALTFAAHSRGRLWEEAFLPVAIERFTVYKPLTDSDYSSWFECRQSIDDRVELDGYLVDSEDDIVLSIKGLRAQRVSASTLQTRTTPPLVNPVGNSGEQNRVAEETGGPEKIAVIGVAGLFPDAPDLDTFWSNLLQGVDSVTEIPASRWEAAACYAPDAQETDGRLSCSKWGAFIEGVDQFDADFFSISPLEAERMDPQQRLFLQVCWCAIEDAGYVPGALSNTSCGVYVGSATGDYGQLLNQVRQENTAQAFMGLNSAILAARIAYLLNLRGPSLAIDTACSASLVAIHQACQALRHGEVDTALAGGVNLMLTPQIHIRTSAAGMLSPTGRCRPFDQYADGIALGEGVGVLLLKPHGTALEAGDTIHGVILNSGINQDGKTNGITAPSGQAQQQLIQRVYRQAGIDPASISYVEAHGTGTVLGDPVEVNALSEVFAQQTRNRGFCALGSVKGNIGHTALAAGVASVIKVLLALKHRRIPPTIHYERPNRHIDLEASPFYVNVETRDWSVAPGERRRAAVSSFGFSGTNAHLVLEESVRPTDQVTAAETGPYIVVLSARTEERLRAAVRNFSDYLQRNPDATAALPAIAYTLQVGRDAMDVRLGLIVNNQRELQEKLQGYLENKNHADLYHGEVKRNKDTLAALTADEDMATIIATWVSKGKYHQLLDLWVKGLAFDWNRLYGECQPRRVSLPTYPFAGERYWITQRPLDGDSAVIQATGVSADGQAGDRETGKKKVGEEDTIQPRPLPQSGRLFLTSPASVSAAFYPRFGEAQRTLASPEAVSYGARAIHRNSSPLVLDNRGDGVCVIGVDTIRLAGATPTPLEDIYLALTEQFQALAQEPTVKVVLLDVMELLTLAMEGATEADRRGFFQREVVLLPLQCPLPVIALMKGDCRGIAWLLGSACDLMIGDEGATYAYYSNDSSPTDSSSGDAGVACSAGEFDFFAARFDPAFARALVVDGGCFDCGQLRAMGLSMPIVPRQRMDAEALALASRLVTMPRQSLSLLKQHLAKPLLGIAQSLDITNPRPPATGLVVEDAAAGAEPLLSRINPPLIGDVDSLDLGAGQTVDIGSAVVEVTAYTQGVVVITLADKTHKNTFSEAFVQGLTAAFAHIQANPRYKVVILTGYDQYFISGGNREGMLAIQDGTAKYADAPLYELPLYCDIPVIAAMQGHAIGAGWALGMFCDVAVFSEESVYCSRFMEFGFTPGFGSTLVFPQRLGRDLGRELLFTAGEYKGRIIKDRRVGISIRARADVLAYAINLALQLARTSREALVRLKADSSEYLRNRLPTVVAQETAMHEQTFFNNANVLQAIEERFQQPPAESVTQLAPEPAPTQLDSAMDTADNPLIDDQLLDTIVTTLKNALAEELHIPLERIEDDMPLVDLGLDSIISVTWVKTINQLYDLSIQATKVYSYPTLNALSSFVLEEGKRRGRFTTAPAPAAQTASPAPAVTATTAEVEPDGRLAETIRATLKQSLAEELHIPLERIEDDMPLVDLGLDSIISVTWVKTINQLYDLSIQATKVYSYPTLNALSSFVLEEGKRRGRFTTAPAPAAQTASHAATPTPPKTASTTPPAATPAPASPLPPVSSLSRQAPPKPPQPLAVAVQPLPEQPVTHRTTLSPIAVIGMAGRFPEADSLETFWANISEGKSCIREIPPSRWDWRAFYGDPLTEVNKTNIKWGGFIDGVDEFDPLFFGLSPHEAALMDPQQRLLLLSVWQAVEDGAIEPKTLSQTTTGVFIAAGMGEYGEPLLSAEDQALSYTGSAAVIMPNRISYILNLQGPSEYCETACSSALVALHRAVQSIERGECEQAIVGAVNLLLSPRGFVSIAAMGYLSPRGRAQSFQADADGFVRAEGVGAVVLKPLSRAQADHNPIRALIRGTGVAHGGKGLALTAPNASGMQAAIKQACQGSGVDPATVSYIEAHGIASPMADGVEIDALQSAYAELSATSPFKDRVTCHIGSLKPCIGHGEIVSGMAALFKVILALYHRTIPGIPGFARPNEHIVLGDGPMAMTTDNQPWAVSQDARGQALPRRAAINGYSLTGVNAHMIIEEYIDDRATADTMASAASGPQLIVLSARTEERLRVAAGNLRAWLDGREQQSLPSLQTIAYTLQVGREAMEYRLALVVNDGEALSRALRQYVSGGNTVDNEVLMFTGNTEDAGQLKQLFSGEEGAALLEVLLSRRNLEKLAVYWVQGGTLPWARLHQHQPVRCLSLPTYPFERQSYWIDPVVAGTALSDRKPAAPGRESARATEPPVQWEPQNPTRESIENLLSESIAQLTQVPATAIKPDKTFYTYGLDSLMGLRLLRHLNQTLQLRLTGEILLQHNTIAALSDYLLRTITPVATAKPNRPAHPTTTQNLEHNAPGPLSEGQKGLWLLQQLAPSMSAYNVPLALRIGSDCASDTLQQACACLVRRYPILQTRIEVTDGIPRQFIDSGQPLDFAQQTLPADLAAADLPEYLARQAKKPFDLATDALMRVRVFTQPGQSTILLLTLHHIICDGSSVPLLLTALLDACEALSRNTMPPMPDSQPEVTRYDDFVRWEQELLAGEEGEAHRAWWRQQLSGDLPLLALPTNRPRPAVQSYAGKTCSITLAPALSRNLKTLAQAREVSHAVLFLALFKTLLYRYTGQQDLIIGTPAAGRPQERFDPLPGYFINMVAIRSQVAADQPFARYLTTVQAALVGALDHSVYPFPRLVADLAISPDLSRSPVFQVYYAFQNFLRGETLDDLVGRYHNLGAEWIDGLHQEGEFELALEVFESHEQFTLHLKYNPELYDRATIAGFLGHYRTLAADIAAEPDKTLSACELLTPEDRHRVLTEWNNTVADYPRDQCLHELFSAQARRTPEATALVFGDRQLSYRELDERTTALAGYLQNRGVRPETLVGICVERSLDMVIGLLGIIKAGGAYLPLDPEYPSERLRYMLEDSRTTILLSQSALAERLSAIVPQGADIIYLDRDWPGIAAAASQPTIGASSPAAAPDNLVYVIYTSGSTGKPKGVCVEHRQLVNFITSMGREPGLTAADRLLSVTSLSFDIHTLELFLPLVTGARLVVAPTAATADATALKACIDRHGISVMQATPSTWSLFKAQGDLEGRQLKVLCGGEALPPGLCHWFREQPSLTVWNLYGPTETSVWSATGCLNTGARGLIGRPINNTRIYIVDEQLQLVPPGVMGEITIGGAGVTRGYLNRAELTAERFPENPHASWEDRDRGWSRIYRTGDYGCWRPDGTLDCLGRVDQQVKIRGFRIEPEEIEHCLNSFPGIQTSVVVAKVTKAEGNHHQLIAYYVMTDDHEAETMDAAALKAFLGERLPDYMMPSALVPLETIPLTPNGKTDRKALSLREVSLPSTQTYIAPRSEIEQTLVGLWQDLLQVESVGIHDNFFDLGGHSLLLAELQAGLQRVFDRTPPMVDLFSHPTIHRLARYLGDKPDPVVTTIHKPVVQVGGRQGDNRQQRRRRHRASAAS